MNKYLLEHIPKTVRTITVSFAVDSMPCCQWDERFVMMGGSPAALICLGQHDPALVHLAEVLPGGQRWVGPCEGGGCSWPGEYRRRPAVP